MSLRRLEGESKNRQMMPRRGPSQNVQVSPVVGFIRERRRRRQLANVVGEKR